MSVVICGPWCVFHSDLETIVNTPWSDFKVMLLTGAVNFAAFFLLTKGLQMLPVVSVNVIVNGVTPALTAAVGILWFVEAYNIFTMLGFVFSIGGTLLISLMAPTQEQSAAPAEQTGDVAASR
jgi:multidrug transporter EmrE-like cation transporter